MSALRQAPRCGRRAIAALLALLAVAAIVVVFSGSLSRSTDEEAQAERAQAEIDRIEERFAAGERELAFVQTEDFVRWQARAFGLGEAGEVPFALEPGAPEPEPIRPIGPQAAGTEAQAPFDAWMELLFGA